MAIVPVLILFPVAVAFGQPTIFCNESNFNLGTLPLRTVVEHTFTLQNIGDTPLTIFQSAACCGTALALSTNVLVSRGSAALTARIGIGDSPGEFDRWISFLSDDPNQTNFTLHARGISVAPADVTPALASFEQVSRTSTTERWLMLRPNFSFDLTNITSNNRHFAVTYYKSASTNSYQIQVKTIPPLPTGVISGEIAISTDNPAIGQLTVPMCASVAGELFVTPSRIALLDVTSSQQAPSYEGVIRSRTKKPFKIVEVTCPCSDIQVNLSFSESGTCNFEIKKSKSGIVLNNGAAISFKTDLNGEQIDLPIEIVK